MKKKSMEDEIEFIKLGNKIFDFLQKHWIGTILVSFLVLGTYWAMTLAYDVAKIKVDKFRARLDGSQVAQAVVSQQITSLEVIIYQGRISLESTIQKGFNDVREVLSEKKKK